MVLFNAAVSAATKKRVFGRTGTAVLSRTLLTSVLVLAAAVIIFLIMKTIMCKTGTWSGGIC